MRYPASSRPRWAVLALGFAASVCLAAARASAGTGRSALFDADFRDYTLNVASSRGNPQPPVGANLYAWQTSVTCSVRRVPDAGGTNWTCTGWTGSGSVRPTGTTTNTGAVLLTNLASSITWQWKTQYWVSVQAAVGGSASPSNGWFDAGQTGVSVHATADNGYRFTGWSGDVVSVQNPLPLDMTRPYTLIARFALDRPIAAFTATPTNGTRPLTVTFTDRSSGPIATREWDFQNDGVIDRIDPSDPIQHTYDLAGTYSVRLRVSGPGGTHVLVRTNYVAVLPPPSNRAPVVCVAAPQVYLPSLGDMATLDASCSTDPDGDPLRFSWREYYENPYLGLLPIGSENMAQLRLYFPSPGRYRFDVRVSDGQSPSAQTRTITVYVPGWRGVVELSSSDGTVRIPDARIAVYASLPDAQNRVNPVDVAIADSLGRYTLANLAPLNSTTARDYYWQVERPGFLTTGVQRVSIRPDPGYGDFNTTVSIGRDALSVLWGVVLATNGAPLEGVSVAAIGIAGQPRVDSSDAAGRFALANVPYGSWLLQFMRAGYRQEVRDVNFGPQTTNLVVHLTPGAGLCALEGQVRLQATERGLAGAKVSLGQGGATVYTDSAGRYRFSGLPLGRTTVTLERNGYQTVRVPSVALGAGTNTLDVRMAFARSGPILWGEVTDRHSGLPIRQATAGIADAWGLLAMSDVTDTAGYYQLVGVPAGSNQTLRVAAPGYLAREVQVSIDSYASANVVLDRAANWRRPGTGVAAGAPQARVATNVIRLADLGRSATIDGSPSTGANLTYLWRELPGNPALNLVPAGSASMASFQVSGFTRPGIYVFELQVRSGPVLSPNVATVSVYAPGLAGNVHASPSDGQFGLPLATVSAYTNYAQAVNAQLTWVDSKQTLDRPPEAVGDFALDGLGTGTYWVVAHGQGYQRYGPARVRVNYGSATRSMAVNLASLEYRFQGRVTDSATGQGLENVQVVLSTGVETELFRTTTDAQGRYALHAVPGGSHPVMFLREGYNAVTHNVTITQDMTKDYTLSRNVSGQLAALAGTITAQFRGLALAVPGAEVILVGGLVRAHTDAAGDYRIDNLPPGNYYGTIRKAGYRPGKLSDLGAGLVTLEAGRTTVADRALLFAETGPVIRGVVVGADGGAVGGASVTVLQAAPKAGAPTKGRTAVLLEAEPVPSDAAGVFQLAGVPEGERLVRVTLPDGTAFTNAINVTGSMEMVATGSQASRIPWDWKERRYGTNAVPAGWDGTDEDRDGRTAWDEYVLDSAPGVSNAPFTARMTLGGGQWQFALDGTSMDRLYDVWWSTNLLRTNWWHSFLGGRRGTGGQLVLSVTNHPRRSHCFYRPAASAP